MNCGHTGTFGSAGGMLGMQGCEMGMPRRMQEPGDSGEDEAGWGLRGGCGQDAGGCRPAGGSARAGLGVSGPERRRKR